MTQTDWSKNLTFNQFNSGLGTLQNIVLNVSYNAQQSATMTFTTPSTITLTSSLFMSVDGLGQSFPDQVYQKTSNVLGLYNAGSNNLTASMSRTLFMVDGFIGNGIINLPAYTVTNSTFYSTSANGGSSILTYEGVNAQLVYQYVPVVVPEPSSCLLIIGGISILSLFKRNNK